MDGGSEQARDLEHQARDLPIRRFRNLAQSSSLTLSQVGAGLHTGRGFVKLHIICVPKKTRRKLRLCSGRSRVTFEPRAELLDAHPVSRDREGQIHELRIGHLRQLVVVSSQQVNG